MTATLLKHVAVKKCDLYPTFYGNSLLQYYQREADDVTAIKMIVNEICYEEALTGTESKLEERVSA